MFAPFFCCTACIRTMPRTRLSQAIGRMHPQWAERGFQVDLIEHRERRLRAFASSRTAARRRRTSCAAKSKTILAEAAPDLDDILVEIEIAPAAAQHG